MSESTETLQLREGDSVTWDGRKTTVEVTKVGGQNILARFEGPGGPYAAERIAGNRFRVSDASDVTDDGTVRELYHE